MNCSRQEVHDLVISAVASSLALEKEEVSATAGLVDELGMDSLDFLDVLFSLEKSLNVKLLGGEINQMLRPGKVQEDELDPYISPEEIVQMIHFIPALEEASMNDKKIPRAKLFKFVTAETLIAIVMKELADKQVAE